MMSLAGSYLGYQSALYCLSGIQDRASQSPTDQVSPGRSPLCVLTDMGGGELGCCLSSAWGHGPVIPASQETEAGGSQVQGLLGSQSEFKPR